MEFKPAFVERYSEILEDVDAFLEYTSRKLRKSIRVNTLKTSAKELLPTLKQIGWKIEKMPCYKDGYFVNTKETVGKTMEHSLGYFYVQ